MKLLWTPIVVAAVVTLAGCEQSSLVGPSAETSALPNTLEGPGPLSALAGNDAPRGKHVYSWNLIGTPHAYQGWLRRRPPDLRGARRQTMRTSK